MTKFLSDNERARLQDRITDLIDEARLGRSCLTCQQFDEPTEVCALAGSRPPARTIAVGCPAYSQAPPF